MRSVTAHLDSIQDEDAKKLFMIIITSMLKIFDRGHNVYFYILGHVSNAIVTASKHPL